MPLPVTKGEFNRLGDRLIAHDRPSEADLAQLRAVLSAYQQVLEQVKGQLHNLGFAPTDRVKTTPTMLDKLRRTHGMELSRMQDLAGARITVRNLAAQDEARDKISEFYTAQACRWRVIDRRKDPRFGYRAVHLVVYVDDLPVEIQIRTELQDTWAQIVERLADRWGRGIRYGQAPENPTAVVRSGDFAASRSEAAEILMVLSDAVAAVEQARRTVEEEEEQLKELASKLTPVEPSKRSPERLASRVPPEIMDKLSVVAKALADHPEQLDDEGRELLAAGGDLTGAQMIRMVEISHDIYLRETRSRADKLLDNEARLRDILQLIASATDEGV
jgi:ppGpp synthetase/RelA/SpoT-type nucleotidyltranferase